MPNLRPIEKAARHQLVFQSDGLPASSKNQAGQLSVVRRQETDREFLTVHAMKPYPIISNCGRYENSGAEDQHQSKMDSIPYTSRMKGRWSFALFRFVLRKLYHHRLPRQTRRDP